MRSGASGPEYWRAVITWSLQTIVGVSVGMWVLQLVADRVQDRGFLLPQGTLSAALMFAEFACLAVLSFAAWALLLGLLGFLSAAASKGSEP